MLNAARALGTLFEALVEHSWAHCARSGPLRGHACAPLGRSGLEKLPRGEVGCTRALGPAGFPAGIITIS